MTDHTELLAALEGWTPANPSPEDLITYGKLMAEAACAIRGMQADVTVLTETALQQEETIARLTRERDAALRTVAAMRPVVEAAVAWAKVRDESTCIDDAISLIARRDAAIRQYLAAQEATHD